MTGDPSSKPRKPSRSAKNRAARLMAVQALYQQTKTGQDAPDIVREYLAYRNGEHIEGDQYVAGAEELFSQIVQGVAAHEDQLREMITAHRQKENEAQEPLLYAILKSGAYELMMTKTDAGIILNDYIDIAHGFFETAEPKLINAVLDKISRSLSDA
jgi:N utilization substance protein B